MIDSVLKGTGNSRFLKSAVPAGTSWADALAMLQAGTFPIDFNGINTEGFQQVGTPLNKANLLKDATAAQIGLPPSTTPDGMFQALGNTGELHVWRKTVTTAQEIPAGYTLESAKETLISTRAEYGSGTQRIIVEYASSCSVSESGDPYLANSSSASLEATSSDAIRSLNNLKGKFLKFSKDSSYQYVTVTDGIFFIPSDATFRLESGPYRIFADKAQKVTGYAKVPAGTTTTYPVSTNPNAYQEGDDEKAAGYVVGEVVTGQFKMGLNDTSNGWNYGIEAEPTVNSDGTFKTLTLNLTTSDFINASNLKTAIAGKFVQLIGYNGYSSPPDTSGPFSSVPGPVIFVPTDVKCTVTNSVLTIDRYQPVTGYAAIPASTTIEYLGKLGDKARMQVVSYVGTGTYGEDNPCSLTFDFPPKVVMFIASVYVNVPNSVGQSNHFFDNYSNIASELTRLITEPLTTNFLQSAGFGDTSSYAKKSIDGRVITWYNYSGDDYQGNISGMKYYYLGIG